MAIEYSEDMNISFHWNYTDMRIFHGVSPTLHAASSEFNLKILGKSSLLYPFPHSEFLSLSWVMWGMVPFLT